MELVPVASTDVQPRTLFLWDIDGQSTVELTELAEDTFLVRASKSYRLVKQDEEGQEMWDRNLRELNQYLANTFSSFSLSVDYCDTTSIQVLDEHDHVAELLTEAGRLKRKASELQDKQESASVAVRNSVDSLEAVMQQRQDETRKELVKTEEQLQQVLLTLEEKKEAVEQWRANGVSLAYTFQFSTDPEVIPSDRLQEAASRHVDEAFDLHRRKVKQVLQGPKFKLHVEELDEPRVYNRLEHTGLLNPDGFEQLLDQVNEEEVEESLKELRRTSAEQYMAVALRDVEVGDSTVERAKATPARAVNSVLQNLKAETVAYAEEVPNNGPMLGTLTGTNQVVGFDPAELPHYYIMGASGFGKSYLKRVIIENIASLGYDFLSISPSDTEEIGLSLPNPENDEGTALSVDQYWIGNDRLLDKPDDINELFTSLNAVTLADLTQSEKQEYVNKIFSRLADIDRSSKPLFVFLEEAHNFNNGAAADAIQKLVREARKFGIHIVVVSQSPTDFSHNHRHVRENTVSLFLRGKFTGYASDFLDDPEEITELSRGEAIIRGPELSKLRVDVRNTLSKPVAPTENEIDLVEQRFHAEKPDFEDVLQQHEGTNGKDESSLSKDEQELLDHIEWYIEEHDERPSKSKCYRPDHAPFGSSKTDRVLEQLLEKGVIEKDTAERSGNDATVYGLVSNSGS